MAKIAIKKMYGGSGSLCRTNEKAIHLWESQYHYVYFIPESDLPELLFMYTCWNYNYFY